MIHIAQFVNYTRICKMGILVNDIVLNIDDDYVEHDDITDANTNVKVLASMINDRNLKRLRKFELIEEIVSKDTVVTYNKNK